jgi:hypothetical protein
MAASSNKRKQDLLTEEDISEVLGKEDESNYSLRNLMFFGLIQVRKIQTVSRIPAVLCMKSEPYEELSDFSQPFVPHVVARPKFAFLSVSGVNVDSDDETSVLECFQKFTDEDTWQ